MIAGVLKIEIEAYARRVRTSNRLFALTKQGRVTREAVVVYVWNLLHMLRQTPIHLQLARARAEERGQHQLAAFFDKKLEEEQGHDRWAVDDIKSLAQGLSVQTAPKLAAPIAELDAFLRATIDEEPSRLLAYQLFAEYFTVLVGPEWLSLLEQHCGVPARSMTAIEHHIELDKDHTDENLRVIDALVHETPSDLGALQETLVRTIFYWDRFYDDLASTLN